MRKSFETTEDDILLLKECSISSGTFQTLHHVTHFQGTRDIIFTT